jgi:hypothetical protein
MGEMTEVIPQGPNRHCGDLEPHDRHVNKATLGGGVGAWCDGVTPLGAFVELTIRVPLQRAGTSHKAAMAFMERTGLGMFVSYLDHPNTALVLRARTQDGLDVVYPVVRSDNGKGFKVVVMPDGG